MLIQIDNNSGQGSHFRNECDGFYMATIKQPSPGFYIMKHKKWSAIDIAELKNFTARFWTDEQIAFKNALSGFARMELNDDLIESDKRRVFSGESYYKCG